MVTDPIKVLGHVSDVILIISLGLPRSQKTFYRLDLLIKLALHDGQLSRHLQSIDIEQFELFRCLWLYGRGWASQCGGDRHLDLDISALTLRCTDLACLYEWQGDKWTHVALNQGEQLLCGCELIDFVFEDELAHAIEYIHI